MKRALLLGAALFAGCAMHEMRTVPEGWARIALACADAQADVTIDGAPAGKAADYAPSNGRLLVKPGWHRIELRSSEGGHAVRETKLGAGDDVALSIALPSKGGSR